ncbi:MAG: HEAT repeat domain-containing protein [Planctomycetes bacterium]|nr:HEAT repeat domain-containing protein [Planctomycetota bacterium]
MIATLCVCLSLFAQADPARDLKSKNVEERLAAVDALAAEGPDKADKLLLGALHDRDWEVVERAVIALGGHGTKAAVPELVDLAVEAPIERMRVAAARALLAIDATRASADLAKLLNGKRADRALVALGILAAGKVDPRAEDAVTKAWLKAKKAKVPSDAALAAGALAASDPKTRGESFFAALESPSLAVRAAALDSIAYAPSARDAGLLYRRLLEPTALDPVIERRLIRAFAAVANRCEGSFEGGTPSGSPSSPGTGPGGGGATMTWERAFQVLGEAADPRVVARGVRQATAIVRSKEVPDATRAAARAAIDGALSHKSVAVRAAAAHAVGEIGDDELAKRVRGLIASDPEARVRHVALRVAVERLGVRDPETLTATLGRLRDDADPFVREEAAVALGVESLQKAAEPLAHALADPQWTVVACAAVSLGKTREDAALAPLTKLAESADWRLRGSAIAGLSHWNRAACVPRMIEAVGDADTAIARLAHEFFLRASGVRLPAEVEVWRKWWAENESKVTFKPTAELRARMEKYGYGSPDYQETYADLDVIVFAGRPGGDNIQNLLGRLGVVHRMTEANRLVGDAVHPDAVYVANCPGEIEPKDAERLQWFVRTGGYLFASCWALHETVERVYPGVVRKYETKSEVQDDVPGACVAPESPYVQGVFREATVPIFKLEGAHLIEVVDPERCQVLVDSPICAERWGSGELAVWFRAGHGLILDSVNHFDLQGFEAVVGLKTPEDRIAFAFDHLGLPYERWRATQEEKFWGSNVGSAKEIPDLFAFRFLTNFVRRKRIGE